MTNPIDCEKIADVDLAKATGVFEIITSEVSMSLWGNLQRMRIALIYSRKFKGREIENPFYGTKIVVFAKIDKEIQTRWGNYNTIS